MDGEEEALETTEFEDVHEGAETEEAFETTAKDGQALCEVQKRKTNGQVFCEGGQALCEDGQAFCDDGQEEDHETFGQETKALITTYPY